MGLPFLDSFSAAAGRGVWHADELGLADAQVVATGHDALDAELPGGGWPVGAMTELLQAAPEAHVWRLLLPALAQAVQGRRGQGRVWVGPAGTVVVGLVMRRLLCMSRLEPRDGHRSNEFWAPSHEQQEYEIPGDEEKQLFCRGPSNTV